jgi:adenosylhomocysteinase
MRASDRTSPWYCIRLIASSDWVPALGDVDMQSMEPHSEGAAPSRVGTAVCERQAQVPPKGSGRPRITRTPGDPVAPRTGAGELAREGESRIAWARRQMPVLAGIAERFARERPLHGIRVSACLAITAETAELMRAIAAGGAEVRLCSSNPLATQDEIAAALALRPGVDIRGRHGEDRASHLRHMHDVLDLGPDVVIDDGGHLNAMVHDSRRETIPGIVGATEQTTTGVLRLRALEAEGRLAFPVIAVDSSPAKHLFDNRYGTGQSVLDGIVRATNVSLAGRRVVVFGYGWCGKGIATRARGAGATVIVCEVDPLRALEAKMDGCEVMRGANAARIGDTFITATACCDVIMGAHYSVMRDGAIVCNAGHLDVEANLVELADMAVERRELRPAVTEFVLGDGRRIYVLARGRVVNLACADGSAASIMDMSFSNHALAIEHVLRSRGQLEAAVHTLPPRVDHEIALQKLAHIDVEIDALSAAQEEYLKSWRYADASA